MLDPDPLDPNAISRKLRPVSVDGDQKRIVRFASALVRNGHLRMADLKGLRVLVNLDNYKCGLRFFLQRFANKSNTYIEKYANVLLGVAKYFCRLPEKELKQLRLMRNRVKIPRSNQMTAKNRERLRQFDEAENVRKLLAYPEEERERGLTQKNAYRAAKCFERALAAALLNTCCLRMQNLRTINLATNVRWADKACFLSFEDEEMKNTQYQEFELPPDVVSLLKEYLDRYRPRFPGANGPYLFPGKRGGPRHRNTMGGDYKSGLQRNAGLTMNPHLIRHAIAKIVIERHPELAFVIQRLLGHKRPDTTFGAYLGTEGRAAGRHVDRLLRDIRRDPRLPKD